MNYDQIVWETGDASGGSSGLGGTSAGAGYSAATGNASQYFEFPGSRVNGALLDSNSATGLTRTSRNSLLPGRHVFEVRNGSAPNGGAIAGTVHDNASPPVVLAGAPVQVCRTSDGHCIFQTMSTVSGQFIATGLPEGDYNVTASAPSGTQLARATVGPIHVTPGATSQVDIALNSRTLLPPGTDIRPSRGNPGGIPVIYWHDDLTLTTTGCVGGSASYVVSQGSTNIRSGSMTESAAGSYSATVAAFYPILGQATVTISITCPDGGVFTIAFDIYIDPSGVVQDQLGHPVPNAIVSIYRADDLAGPFATVPDGSSILSPENRTNPDITDGSGHFGWDVIAGYYYIQAQKDGCTSAEGGPYAQTPTLTIPPAQLDLVLTLNCPTGDTQAPTATADLSGTDVDAGSTSGPKLVTLTATDNADGSGVAGIHYTLSGAESASGFVSGDSATILIEAVGETTIEYYAVDEAGNQQTPQQVVVTVSALSEEDGSVGDAAGTGGTTGGTTGGGQQNLGGASGAGGTTSNGGTQGGGWREDTGGTSGAGEPTVTGGAGGAAGAAGGTGKGGSTGTGATGGAGGRPIVDGGGLGGEVGTTGTGIDATLVIDGELRVDLPTGSLAPDGAAVTGEAGSSRDGGGTPNEAGSTTLDGGATAHDSSAVDAVTPANLDTARASGVDAGSPSSGSTGGCGCRLVPASNRTFSLLLVGVALLAWRRRQRR